MNDPITQKWKDETIKQAKLLSEREALYQNGFRDGHQQAQDYIKTLIRDEIWKYHELTVDFLKLHSLKASSQLVTEINEICVKSHNEVLEKLIKLL